MLLMRVRSEHKQVLCALLPSVKAGKQRCIPAHNEVQVLDDQEEAHCKAADRDEDAENDARCLLARVFRQQELCGWVRWGVQLVG